MTGKRFKNRLDKNNIKFNILNPVWDNEKEDALNVFEMIDLLNEQDDMLEVVREELSLADRDNTVLLKENEQLKQCYQDYIKLKRVTNDCKRKNEQLKQELKTKEVIIDKQYEELQRLKKENEQLQQQIKELKSSNEAIKWVRENTVWEQMPTNRRTYTKTSYER